MSGWVKIHRALADHPLFRDNPAWLGAWVLLVIEACWKPTRFNVKGRTITLARGQVCVSTRALAARLGWSKSATSRFLARLKSETMIGTDSGTSRNVITICNYEQYQDDDRATGTVSGTESGTTSGQHRDTKEEEEEGKNTQGARESGDLFSGNGTDPSTGGESKAKSKRVEVTVEEFPDFIDREVAEGFLEVRRAKRAKLTPYALKLLTKELMRIQSAGIDPNDALNYAIKRNWTGCDAEWVIKAFASGQGEESEARKLLRSMGPH